MDTNDAILVAAVGALLGAFTGGIAHAVFTDFRSRARPSILIRGIELSHDLIGGQSPANPNRALVSAITSNPHANVPLNPVGVNTASYTAFLAAGSIRVERALQWVPAVASLSGDFAERVRLGDFDGLEELLSESGMAHWAFLEGANLRGEFDLPDKQRNGTHGQRIRLVDDEQYVVVRSGQVQNIPLAPPRAGSLHRAQALAFNRRVAEAVAYRDQQDLTAIASHLKRAEQDLVTLRDLGVRLDSELTLYSRLVVTGHFMNSGRAPFTVLDEGELFIFMKDFHYRPDGATSDLTCTSTITARLDIGSPDARPDDPARFAIVPLGVPAGGMQPFTAIAKEPLGGLDHAEGLKRALDAGERQFRIGVRVVKSGGKTPELLYSAPRLFREQESASLEIPEPD